MVGDGNGRVGLGYGKAREVPLAIQKAMEKARRDLQTVQLDGTRAGGYTEMLKAAALTQAWNVKLAPHAMEYVHLSLAAAVDNVIILERLRIFDRASSRSARSSFRVSFSSFATISSVTLPISSVDCRPQRIRFGGSFGLSGLFSELS